MKSPLIDARRKPGMIRRVIGDVLIIQILLYTVYLIIFMLHQIHSVVLTSTYHVLFLYELITCGTLILFSLDLRFGFFTRLHPVILKAAGWGLRILVTAFTAVILFFSSKVILGGMVNTAQAAQHAIVLGMALEDEKPTRDLLYRIDAANDYLDKYPSATLVLSGGNSDKNGVTEAAVMRDLLVERGVPEEKLMMEESSTSTLENFLCTAQLLDPAEPVVVISSNYHMDRAVWMAKKAGFTQCMRLPAPADPLKYGIGVLHEVIADLDDLL